MANTIATAQTKTQATKTVTRKTKAQTMETLTPVTEVLTTVQPIEAIEIPVEKINFNEKDSNGRRKWNLQSLRAKVMMDLPEIAKGNKIVVINMVREDMVVLDQNGEEVETSNSLFFQNSIRRLSAEHYNNQVTSWTKWFAVRDLDGRYLYTKATIELKQRVKQAEPAEDLGAF